ncbi:MAG: hypothetical protein Q8N83_14590 [Ignavibacteria bacterium]|nr:hypothetical protein [Ignavibacteria bacterium]
MEWQELYPIVKDQSYWSVLRYDSRRADKQQELICQAFQLYKTKVEKGLPINKNEFKQFISKRSREVDFRSICPKGTGGTSSLDPLSFVNRRSTSPITVVEFSEWMNVTPKTKENVEANVVFSMDYNDWLQKLSDAHKQILEYLIQGFTAPKIASIVKESVTKVRTIIKDLQKLFVQFFRVQPPHA